MDLRRDEVAGRWVAVAPARAARPGASAEVTDELEACPFCAGHEGRTPPETLRLGDGPTVVVIGDSFTRGYWQDYFALRAGRYIWMHHEQCGFMLNILESYAPDIVILAPTERQMFCTGR